MYQTASSLRHYLCVFRAHSSERFSIPIQLTCSDFLAVTGHLLLDSVRRILLKRQKNKPASSAISVFTLLLDCQQFTPPELQLQSWQLSRIPYMACRHRPSHNRYGRPGISTALPRTRAISVWIRLGGRQSTRCRISIVYPSTTGPTNAPLPSPPFLRRLIQYQ